jgi:hypothetical protein
VRCRAPLDGPAGFGFVNHGTPEMNTANAVVLCPSTWLGCCNLSLSPRAGNKTSGGSQQQLTVFCRALSIQPQQRQFIPLSSLRGSAFVIAVHKVLDPNLENLGNTSEVRGDLSGSSGLPLGDRAA